MAEQPAVHTQGKSGCQDSGNPVLDSTVNIMRALYSPLHDGWQAQIEELHSILLKLAAKEPGGLRARVIGTQVQKVQDST